MHYDLVEKLKKEIAGFRDEPALEAVGTVVETGDGIAKISGLSRAQSQELLKIETASSEVFALAFNLEEHFIGAVILGVAEAIKIGDRVRGTGNVLSIPVGKELLGRVVDPLGEPLDGKGAIFKDNGEAERYPLEKKAPSVVARESVNTPLHTGIKAIDAMIPIGRGQRELIIGDRQTGKTKYTIIVSASASSPASLQYLAPSAGCAIGEYFMDHGKDALVIYDDLSKHADAYRELSLLLRRPPGREAYPGDIFYLHSRLLERAAKLNKENGGGSLTALPIIETKLGDISAYIPTNVISITDGQIYLESNLFYKGVRPALNVGLSVSRVGSAAQTKAIKKVAGRLRLELAQFRELEAFVQFASDLDDATKQKIHRGQILTEVLKQADLVPLRFTDEAVILYVALAGYLDDVPTQRIKDFERELLDYIEKMYDDAIFGAISKSRTLDDATEATLKKAVEEFKRIFNNGHRTSSWTSDVQN
ncbi:MAG: ATP synthase subunit alpha [Parcubacteria group bacterium GW2011_GWA2_47_10b]|nr:MAG: ATP synthase subunit alpha [Parcubacteria group bacterium GW2011_GWA2_47_10b]